VRNRSSLAAILLILACLQLAQPVGASAVPVIEYSYVDVEVRELSGVVYANGTIYAAGSTGSYVVVAAYRDGARLWMQTISLPGSPSILDFKLKGGALDAIVYTRAQANSSLWLLRVGLDGSLLERRVYATLYPRIFPLVALRIGDSIYVAGSSYLLGFELNYMVARVSERGVEWVIEDLGGPGNDSFKCLVAVAGSRLLAAGDNTTSALIALISQTGSILGYTTISYPNSTITVNGCLKLSESRVVLYGALNARPLILPVAVDQERVAPEEVKVLNLTGVITAAASRGDLLAFYMSSGDSSLLAVYSIEGSVLKLLNVYNITGVARGYIALSAAFENSRLASAASNGASALILSLVITLAQSEPRLPRISFLEVLGDPRLTLVLSTLIVLLAATIAYLRLRRRKA